MQSPTQRSRFSQDVRLLLEHLSQQPLTLRDILATTSERGFSLVIGLLVLPFLFPMPPGLTTILGSGCLLLSLQMMVGRRSPWLPRRIAQFQFPPTLIHQLLHNLSRVSRVADRVARPRWHQVTAYSRSWQLNGLCISWLTVLLMLPVPFTNPLPTAGILLFAIAMLESDGLLLCLAYGVTAMVSLFFGAIAYALWQSPQIVEQLLPA